MNTPARLPIFIVEMVTQDDRAFNVKIALADDNKLPSIIEQNEAAWCSRIKGFPKSWKVVKRSYHTLNQNNSQYEQELFSCDYVDDGTLEVVDREFVPPPIPEDVNPEDIPVVDTFKLQQMLEDMGF